VWSRSSYVDSLRDLFADKPALYVSGSGPIDVDSPQITKWLELVASIIGLDLSRARVLPLKSSKSGNVSVAALIGGTSEVPKVITLRVGANGLPGCEGRLRLLAEISDGGVAS
jgi:hypothetical protein